MSLARLLTQQGPGPSRQRAQTALPKFKLAWWLVTKFPQNENLDGGKLSSQILPRNIGLDLGDCIEYFPREGVINHQRDCLNCARYDVCHERVNYEL